MPHSRAIVILCDAAANSGLKDGFAHVRELGDFSVVYRVAGLLEDVTSLISARSRLRTAMLDSLHAANVEIVSPNFMNTRTIAEGQRFIPTPARKRAPQEETQAEQVVFDKAEEAASAEKIRYAIEQVDAALEVLDQGGDANPAEREALDRKKARLLEQLKEADEAFKALELAEKDSS